MLDQAPMSVPLVMSTIQPHSMNKVLKLQRNLSLPRTSTKLQYSQQYWFLLKNLP